jgi:hypothetical protein
MLLVAEKYLSLVAIELRPAIQPATCRFTD